MKELLEFCQANRDVIIPTTFGGLYDLLNKSNHDGRKPVKRINFKSVVEDLADNPDIVFGGSLSLKALKLLDREPKDIDIFVPANYSISKLRNSFTLEETETASETTTDIDGVEIKRIGLKLNGIKVCVFFVEDNSYSNVRYEGIKIKVQSCNSTIQAKKAYIRNGAGDIDKHKEDLKTIAEKLCDPDIEIPTSEQNPDDLPF